MAVLYRKYRPQTFEEVLGQKHVVRTLQNQVLSNSVAHAYLFTGSRGVGKTSIARILAKAVNCKNQKNGQPDGTCDICQQITNNNFLDLVEIDAASNTGVDNIRDLIEHVKFAPSIGKFKVFIIDEVHMLSKGAFNALLKTLEEPPSHTIFVLATTEINKVPATIISRTQRFDFHSPSQNEIAEYLGLIIKKEQIKISKEILELVASGSQGSVRDALSLLEKVLSLGNDPAIEDCLHLLGVTDISLSHQLVSMLVEENKEKIPDFFDSLNERGVDFIIFNRDFLEYLRKLLLQKVGGNTEGLSEEYKLKLKELSDKFFLQDIIFIIKLFLKSYKDIPYSPMPELPLLLAALEACTRKAASAPTFPNSKSPAVLSQTITQAPKEPKEPTEPSVSKFAFTHILEPTVGAPIVTEAIEMANIDESATLEFIEPYWTAIIENIKRVNSPLGNLVKTFPLQKVEGGRVYLGVKFLFHKQNLESQKNLKIICDAIKEVTGKSLGICGQITKDDPKIETAVPSEMISDALRILGGELVD